MVHKFPSVGRPTVDHVCDLHSPLRRFATAERGSMSVLSLFVFVAMLLVGGLAVDMMRHEAARLQMQGTADRAVLAATLLRETPSGMTAEEIVQAYFAAEGLTDQLGDRVYVQAFGANGRSVTAAPAASLPSTFSRLLGIDSLDMVTPARAIMSLGGGVDIELVLVMDVSGSMNGQNKIGLMRDAALDLITSLLTENDPERVAITVVPYDAWVLPPANFLNRFTNVSGTGACNDWTTWNDVENSLTLSTQRRNCNTDVWATVAPFQNNLTALTTIVNGLRARGTTSIDLGVRFGALFFDPSIRPAIEDLITAGTVPATFSGRPLDWDTEDAVRAMVILTDGQNCCGARYADQIQDDNTESICTALKDNGVLVYSIAFEAPRRGSELMQACASSPSHYFNADVSEIMSAFQAIGSNLQAQALRLTQ